MRRPAAAGAKRGALNHAQDSGPRHRQWRLFAAFATQLPCRHAKAVASALENLNIDVLLGVDLPFDDTVSTVQKFIDKANDPLTTVSVLYYSGHGVQLNGENYIVPVDFDSSNSPDFLLYSIQSVLDKMKKSRP